MLPHVNAEDGHLAPNNRVLVLGRHNREPRLLVLHQPSPPTPLDPQKRAVELLLERVEATPRLPDLRHERRGRLGLGVGGGAGGQVLPEEGVVDVAAAVEADGGLEGDAAGDVARLGGGRLGLERVVEVRHVGVVVLAVVELHDLGRDAGLKSLNAGLDGSRRGL